MFEPRSPSCSVAATMHICTSDSSTHLLRVQEAPTAGAAIVRADGACRDTPCLCAAPDGLLRALFPCRAMP